MPGLWTSRQVIGRTRPNSAVACVQPHSLPADYPKWLRPRPLPEAERRPLASSRRSHEKGDKVGEDPQGHCLIKKVRQENKPETLVAPNLLEMLDKGEPAAHQGVLRQPVPLQRTYSDDRSAHDNEWQPPSSHLSQNRHHRGRDHKCDEARADKDTDRPTALCGSETIGDSRHAVRWDRCGS